MTKKKIWNAEKVSGENAKDQQAKANRAESRMEI